LTQLDFSRLLMMVTVEDEEFAKNKTLGATVEDFKIK
jgi:hypothetical protein